MLCINDVKIPNTWTPDSGGYLRNSPRKQITPVAITSASK